MFDEKWHFYENGEVKSKWGGGQYDPPRAMEMFAPHVNAKIFETRTLSNHHLMSKSKFQKFFPPIVLKVCPSAASIFLKQQWNFVSSVFMPSLRRPALPSISTSWRLFIRGLHPNSQDLKIQEFISDIYKRITRVNRLLVKISKCTSDIY